MQGKDDVTEWFKFHDYDFRKYKGILMTDKIARNLVDYEAGKTIFDTALGVTQSKQTEQTSIFDLL